MLTRLLAAVAIVCALGACAMAPTADQLASADYGAQPQHPETAIHLYFETTLKDPSSAQYREITKPVHGWIRDPIVAGGKTNYGWQVDVAVNAKNSYGAYVGFKTYSFLFRGEEIVDLITPDTIMVP